MMRKFLLALLACLGIGGAAVTMAPLPFLPGFGGAGGFLAPLPSLSFAGCTIDGADLTTYTYSSHGVGTAGGNRATIVGVMSRDSAATYDVSSVTVAGAAASEIVDEGGTDIANTAIYILANPAGTAEDVVVTFSEAVVGSAICVWAAYNLNSLAATASAADNDAASGALALSLNTANNGVAVGVCESSSGANQAATWTGLTERFENAGDSTDWNNTGADVTEDGSGATPLTVTCDWDGSSPASGATASFR